MAAPLGGCSKSKPARIALLKLLVPPPHPAVSEISNHYSFPLTAQLALLASTETPDNSNPESYQNCPSLLLISLINVSSPLRPSSDTSSPSLANRCETTCRPLAPILPFSAAFLHPQRSRERQQSTCQGRPCFTSVHLQTPELDAPESCELEAGSSPSKGKTPSRSFITFATNQTR